MNKLWIMIRSDKRGMSLVEIMVAMIILGIALSWLAPLVIIAMRGTKRGGDLTQATTQAQDKLEEFRSMSYASMLASPTGQDTLRGVARSWTVTEETDQPGLARILIDLSWYDDAGDEHQVQFVSLRARAQ